MLFDDMSFLKENKNPNLFNESAEDDIEMESIQDSVNECVLMECFEGLNEEEINEFVNDPDFKVMAEAMKLKNKTVMKLSKKDDLERRESMMVVQIAKEKNDPLAKLLAKAIRTKKKIMAKLHQKYGKLAKKRSIASQKEYIKNSKTINKIKNKIMKKREEK